MYDIKMPMYNSKGRDMMQMTGGRCMKQKKPIQNSEGHDMIQMIGGKYMTQISQSIIQRVMI